jgi:hypothetical protein
MARREERLTIADKDPAYRDNSKTFVLMEMDAYSGQKWATRALFALGSSGLQLPSEALGGGWAALAGFAFQALLSADYRLVEPLLDEMLAQAKYEHLPGQPLMSIAPGKGCVVEEIKTFLTLQSALFKLHTGFSLPAVGPTSAPSHSPRE